MALAPVRIVLDTNIVISALLWRGAPHELLACLRQHSSVDLFSSSTLLEELAAVLSRPAIAQRLTTIGKSSRDVLTDYVEAIELVEPIELPRVARDPDDNHVLACALAANADVLVSGDADLLSLDTFRNIRILTARQLLDRLERLGD
ncbi:MAG: putative toxin-antitoxin system toxin component, PIN family [Gammaproteobacteria bacterium]